MDPLQFVLINVLLLLSDIPSNDRFMNIIIEDLELTPEIHTGYDLVSTVN